MPQKIDQIIELLNDWHGKTISCQPIYGGITNQNFKVTVDKRPYFVSISSNTSTLLGINLSNKFYNNKICEQLGLSPTIVHFLAEQGVLVTDFFPFPSLSATHLHNSAVQKRLVIALKTLHSGPKFLKNFDMFKLIKDYERIVQEKNIKLPENCETCLVNADTIGKSLEQYRQDLVPCHNDLIPENIFDDGQKIYFIDFDYSGQNDLYFDLGNLCIEAKHNDTQVREFLNAYFGQVNDKIVSRTCLHGALSDIGWSLWSFIQDPISSIEFDFRKYGLNRWNRVVNKIESGAIDKWLQCI